MRTRPDLDFRVHWRPFFLDRTLPAKGINKVAPHAAEPSRAVLTRRHFS